VPETHQTSGHQEHLPDGTADPVPDAIPAAGQPSDPLPADTDETPADAPLIIPVTGEAAGAPAESAFDVANDIEFDRAFRGYDRTQVDDYIDKLTLDYNAICQQCHELEQENKGLRRVLAALERLPEEDGENT